MTEGEQAGEQQEWVVTGGLFRAEGSGGARGIRTPDLLNAIQTLSQLSYSPTWERGV
jgi:hypothetical protein